MVQGPNNSASSPLFTGVWLAAEDLLGLSEDYGLGFRDPNLAVFVHVSRCFMLVSYQDSGSKPPFFCRKGLARFNFGQPRQVLGNSPTQVLHMSFLVKTAPKL